MNAEHRELDHALAEVEFLAERRAFHGAGARFRDFRQRFLDHMRDQERDPRIAEATRPQHAQLETALESVASALEQCDYAEFCYGVTALGKLLAAHQRVEEQAVP